MIVCLLRLVVRTSGFHPDNSSSILLGDDQKKCSPWVSIFFGLASFALPAKGRAFLLRKNRQNSCKQKGRWEWKL